MTRGRALTPCVLLSSLQAARYDGLAQLKLQLAIRAQRGCVTDHESIARDSQIFSKALVGWGEQQPELDEVKDESDRIACA